MTKLRDMFWIWGHAPGSHDGIVNRSSRMTLSEAACYLDVPNGLMVRYWGKPAPPFDQEAMAIAHLDQVIWSIVGCSPGMPERYMEDLNEVMRLAGTYSNIKGGILDDFFVNDRDAERIKHYPPKEIARTRETMHRNPAAPLDLWVVLYEYQLNKDVGETLQEFDGVTFWTWHGSALSAFDENYAKYRALAGPNMRTMLGCYMYNYGEGKEFSEKDMAFQLERYSGLVRQGEVEGIILLCNCVADLGLEAVEYTRGWLAEYGDEEIGLT